MLRIFDQSVLQVDLLQSLSAVRMVVPDIGVHVLQQVLFSGNVVEVRRVVDDGRLRELGIGSVLQSSHFLVVLYQLRVGKASERGGLGQELLKHILV